MNIFSIIWEWIKKIFKAIYDYWNPPTPEPKPTVKITILVVLLFFMFIPMKSIVQRSDVQSAIVIFNQPGIENIDYWNISWGVDSIKVYKNDSLNVAIRNNSNGNWYKYIDLPNKQDTMLVNVKINSSLTYNDEHTFSVVAVDSSGNMSDSSNTINVYWIMSDINKVNDSGIERGYILGDERIDGLDLIELSKYWGRINWIGLEDITGDGKIDGLDLIQMSKDWGKSH